MLLLYTSDVQCYCYIDYCNILNIDSYMIKFLYRRMRTNMMIDKSNGQTVILVHLLICYSGEY